MPPAGGKREHTFNPSTFSYILFMLLHIYRNQLPFPVCCFMFKLAHKQIQLIHSNGLVSERFGTWLECYSVWEWRRLDRVTCQSMLLIDVTTRQRATLRHQTCFRLPETAFWQQKDEQRGAKLCDDLRHPDDKLNHCPSTEEPVGACIVLDTWEYLTSS